jgi:hypothetical protein
VNTGGGGGGAGATGANTNRNGGAGGSGVVIIRHPLNFSTANTTGNPTITQTDSFKVYTFTSSGTISWS